MYHQISREEKIDQIMDQFKEKFYDWDDVLKWLEEQGFISSYVHTTGYCLDDGEYIGNDHDDFNYEIVEKALHHIYPEDLEEALEEVEAWDDIDEK